MKKIFINSLIIFALTFNLQAQSKPSIAAGNPNVNGLYASPTIASKLIRLELIKLDMYSVYDEFDMADVLKVSDEFFHGKPFGMLPMMRPGESDSPTPGVGFSGNKVITRSRLRRVPQLLLSCLSACL